MLSNMQMTTPNQNNHSFTMVTLQVQLQTVKPNVAFNLADAPTLFENFIRSYQKKYQTPQEHQYRYSNFFKTLQEINKINEAKQSIIVAPNFYADFTKEEKNLARKQLLGNAMNNMHSITLIEPNRQQNPVANVGEGKLLATPPNVPSCAAADHDQSEVLELLYPYIAKIFYSFVRYG
ncbi:cathepsin propeptide inhibitor domain (I29) domain-containing protein [Phthorimaea operculella]|nr:cathepsin propeptide inhibitor domain (I29) domain-containing protein [Phthorimaea operculella]